MTFGSIIAILAAETGAGEQVSATAESVAEDIHGVLPVGEAILKALFMISIVFIALLIIFLCIKIFSAVLNAFDHKKDTSTKAPVAAAATTAPASAPVKADAPEEDFSSGTLKLKGCDEKTAAMVMAIVADDTGIPLSELVFKSITLVEKK